MTRPKVHPDQRQRTAQACDSCKRRKQKCNGLCPCVTCEKRNLSCTYGSLDYGSDEASPSKKRLVEPDAAITHALSAKLIGSSYPRTQTNSPRTPKPQGAPWGYSEEANAFGEALQSHDNVKEEPNRPSTQATNRPNELVSISREQKPTAMSRGTTLSGNDEEAVVYTAPRMLQDSTGRLLYLGDSATLSYLQLIRMIVENVTGPSPFTTDPRRHRIMENSFTLPPGLRYTHVLPDRITADVLLDSFFANTSGLLHVFDEVSFRTSVEECYNDPLATDPSWLCLLNLTFAVGLVLATPRPGTNDEAVIEHLRNGSLDRAEVFFMNAKSLNDPVTGFEDAGFWSIQALLLMTTYMLTVSKRNAAFAYFGMAVRSAFALGIHREETMVIYSIEDQQERRNLWRSLFVFDRFLSASLGRPVAISESDCSGDTLTPPEEPTFPMAADVNQSNLLGLEATVRSCHAIGIILKRVYQKRRISTKIAQDIADICKRWPNGLAPVLNWQHALGAVPRQAVAILHANLFYCHSIILLTRPFFLFLLNAKVQKGRPSTTIPLQRPGGRMEKFAAACVTASSHSVELCLNAFQGGCLQRRNPFVIYFLFTSALVLLSSEFSSPSATPPETITKAITIMAYCAEADPQANRLLYILSTFRDVVNSRYLNRNHQLAGGDPNTAIFKEADESAIFTPAGGLQASLTSPRAEVERPSIGSQNLGPVVQQRRKGSFGVDLQSIGNSLTVGSDESSNGDEAFDFETFWNWPANTPVNEEIREGIVDSRNEQGNINNGSAVNEASVPLFGMVDIQ